jgi:hypothetical protein
MYSNIDNEDIFASAMEEAEIVENPFAQGAGDGEPLHAVDAARRLLGGDDNDQEYVDPTPTPTPHDSDNQASAGGAMGNSLLERIQQQKKHQNTTQTTHTSNTSNMTHMTNTSVQQQTQPYSNVSQSSTSFEPASSQGQFGYPVVEEGAYSTPGTASNIRIPEYSQVPAPSAYNTENTSYYDSARGAQESTDYKGQMMNILTVVGNAASTAAKGAYEGTKVVYGKLSNKSSNTGPSPNVGSTREMDYQRESLLMDPHDLEDRAAQMSTSVPPPASNSSPSGMRAGIISANTTSGGANSFLTYAKQVVTDLKDLYLGASRRVQIGIVLFFAFIVWLIVFE